MSEKKGSIALFLSLFASLSTLICCALPALLVSIGMGAVVAGLVSNVPQIIWLSENKAAVFSAAALLLLVAGYFQFFVPQSCPTDPQKAAACQKARKISRVIYFFSVIIYGIGFFFAFVAQYLI